MVRPQEVKERLRPMMDRMTASLAKIQALEDSILKRGDELLAVKKQELEESFDIKTKTGKEVAELTTRQSRRVLKKSMEMMKRKLHRLQIMEHTINISEKQNQRLRRHISEASRTDTSLLEATAVEQPYKDRIAGLENECAMMEEKCTKVDELQRQVSDMAETTENFYQQREELFEVRKQNEALVAELEQRQTDLVKLATKCKESEFQVEQLKALCNELSDALAVQGKRGDNLEQELMEHRKSQQRAGQAQSRPPSTIQSKDFSDGDSAEQSDGHNELSGLNSTYPMNSSFEVDISDRKESPAKTAATNDLSSSFLSSTSSLGNAEASNASEISTIRRLMSKVENLDSENGELLESRRKAYDKIGSLVLENSRQASRIRELEKQLQRQSSSSSISGEDQTPPAGKDKGKSQFLKRLLTADAKELRQLINERTNKKEKTQIKQ